MTIKEPTSPVVVIGGGIGGSVCALRLAQHGRAVTLLEASPTLGGLVNSFEVNGTPLECFYHHVFPHETHIIDLINELGLGDRLEWLASSTGVYTDGRIWPFTTAKDLLRFAPLPLHDRVHTGLGALRMSRVREWESLDRIPAERWLAGFCGKRATALVWRPLLAQKFGPAAPDVPAAWIWSRFQQRGEARRRGGAGAPGERLGYLRGGFRQLFDRLTEHLREAGVDVRLGESVSTIDTVEASHPERSGHRVVSGVRTSSGSTFAAPTVVFAGTLPRLLPLLPEEAHDPRWSAARGLGAMCVILQLARPLQNQYWVNVCDEGLPFGGIIEHTNFVPAADYGGRHVVYLSRYFTADEEVATADPQEEGKRWLEQLLTRFPDFDPSDVLGRDVFRTPYAAPLVHLGYRQQIPPHRSHIDGLWVATTAQIYPQDRGMSEGVRMGSGLATSITDVETSDRPTVATQ